MVRFLAAAPDKKMFVGISLSPQDIKCLEAGEAIHLSAEQLGCNDDVMLFAGDDQAMRSMVTKNYRVVRVV